MTRPDQRTVVVGGASAEALWAAFAANGKEQEPPPGSMSAREFCDKFGGDFSKVRQRLIFAANSGKMTATPVKRFMGGKLRTVIYYTPKEA